MYQDIVGFALATPGWLHTFAEVGTDAGLFVFAALFVVAGLRAWRAPARDLALVIAGPAGIVMAYVVSEVVKLLIREDRPCRGGITTIAVCPPPEDWSFPSNHSVIAAGAAATLVLVWRSLAWVVFPLALVMAFSRVFVGVHYPHDVAAGFLLGTALAPLFALLVVGAVTPAVRLARAYLAELRSAGRGGSPRYAADPPQPSVAPMSRSRIPGSE
ncbi:undecaprenyl-diphosphatase [Nonomuraea solani]|uniref:Undecaprenyl-diphosphatase n=1 Tax=Nonomuraea solani TaxID=1144553 RepID=A0A1H6BDT6_9ACTN|nr:phosphatase PAP2 family protein [Nonomuraea solani]SEG58983.1 undecaprenyl-diphosphatase [Nonomuraea solani]